MRRHVRNFARRLLVWAVRCLGLVRRAPTRSATTLSLSSLRSDAPFGLVSAEGAAGVGFVARGEGTTRTVVRPNNVAARILQRCRLPRVIRPSDFGLPYVVIVRGAGQHQYFFGPDDDLSSVLRNE